MSSTDTRPSDGGSPDFPVGASVTITTLSDDLHRTLARLRRTEPISRLPAIGGWLVTDYASAVEILRDPERFTVDDERFTTGRVVGPSMLSTDGAAHRSHRQPFEPMFRGGAVAETGGAITTTATELLEGLRANGEAELRSTYAAPLAVDVIARFLGFHHDGDSVAEVRDVNRRLLGAYRSIVATVVGLGTGDTEPDDAADAMEQISELVEGAVQQGGPLAQVVAAESVTAEQLRSNVAVILFGAIETCEGMTANAIGHVLDNESVADRVRSGDVDVGRVVNESLRLEPAAAVVDRYATTDVEMTTAAGTVVIGRGDLVEVSLAGANRDPAVFPDPDRFDPQRSGVGHHLAFARGPHVCLGLHLARLQTTLALRALLAEFPTLRIDRDRSTPPRGHIFRKPERIVAVW